MRLSSYLVSHSLSLLIDFLNFFSPHFKFKLGTLELWSWACRYLETVMVAATETTSSRPGEGVNFELSSTAHFHSISILHMMMNDQPMDSFESNRHGESSLFGFCRPDF